MMGGLAYMTGRHGDPLRAPSSLNDIMGGMFGAIGAMAALARRAVTGKDQAVQTALFKMNVFVVTQHRCNLPSPTKPHCACPAACLHEVFTTFSRSGTASRSFLQWSATLNMRSLAGLLR